MYELTQKELRQVRKYIGKFNHNRINLVSDHLVKKQFAGTHGELEGKLSAMVILLDSLFGTQLKMAPKGAGTLISTLESKWDGISKILDNPQLYSLIEHPNNVYKRIVKPIFRTIPNIKIPKKKGAKDFRKSWPYSFVTKLFHWCSPEYFPIVDSKTRVGIREFQKAKGIRNGNIKINATSTGKKECIKEYEKWIIFYSGLIADNAGFINDLRNHDEDTQRNTRDALFIPNSPLRILDKYFYIRGKELDT